MIAIGPFSGPMVSFLNFRFSKAKAKIRKSATGEDNHGQQAQLAGMACA
jgi:hypothetical protein